MKKHNVKFFVGIGILLLIAGVLLYPDDRLIGIIGIFFGISNIFKGIQLYRGIEPFIIRKQKERDQKVDDELRDEMDRNSKK